MLGDVTIVGLLKTVVGFVVVVLLFDKVELIGLWTVGLIVDFVVGVAFVVAVVLSGFGFEVVGRWLVVTFALVLVIIGTVLLVVGLEGPGVVDGNLVPNGRFDSGL